MSTNYISQITASNGTTYDIQEGVTTRLFRATCPTAAGTAAKVATLDDATGYSLAAGVRVAVTFTYGNSAATPTLNVNSGGAKTIVTPTAVATLTSGNGTTYNTWGPYETVIFTYNGTYWVKGGTGYAIYNAYALANSKGSGTVTGMTTTAGAHTAGSQTVSNGIITTNIPTKTSHLTNDSGFLTSHQTAVTSLTTTAGSHTTKSSATGAVSIAIPTKTSHLTNDSGFITSYTDTKNTAGSTNTNSKLYLIGATEQSTNPQTYSNSRLYYSGGIYSYAPNGSISSTIHQSYNQIESIVTNTTDYANGLSITNNGVTLSGNSGGVQISITNTGTAIHELIDPTAATDAANKQYVDSSISNYLPLSGGTMTGPITMAHALANGIQGTLQDGSSTLPMLCMTYSEGLSSNYIALGATSNNIPVGIYGSNILLGNTGNLSLSGTVTVGANPTSAMHVATKDYVDLDSGTFTADTSNFSVTGSKIRYNSNLGILMIRIYGSLKTSLASGSTVTIGTVSGATPGAMAPLACWNPGAGVLTSYIGTDGSITVRAHASSVGSANIIRVGGAVLI